MSRISSAVSENPNTSTLARIRSGVTDFGITTISWSMCQRSTTWAGDTSCAWAIRTSTGSDRSLVLNGLYPSSATPRSRWAAYVCLSYSDGLHRIWLTAGVSSVAWISSSICPIE